MPRRKTTKVSSRRRAPGSKQVNLHVRTKGILWSKTKKAGSGFVKFLMVLLVIAVCGVGGYRLLLGVFLENDEFFLDQVELLSWEGEGEPRLLDKQRLQEVTGLETGKSLFAYNLRDLEKKLVALPEITQARAIRHYPNVVRISVEERVPVAWLDCPKKGVIAKSYRKGLLVDEEGYCFAPTPGMRGAVQDLPVIAASHRDPGRLKSGQKLDEREVMRALELVKLSSASLEGTGWTLPVVGLNNEYSLMAKTHLGTSVVFGLYEHERQLDDLILILNHARQSDRGVEWTNLIPERNIPVVLTGTERAMALVPSPVEYELDEILKRG
ncbi:MAG: FtsQ-type POTRA domain-containing protein [Verrucomicrobiota bacterium JB023]|nr:FtsQ-type POTRA domain-containing protein [Verrucomicrobiota bacterium JB023]